MLKILHNPRCQKSREALALLQAKGLKFEIIEYLKSPLDRTFLVDLLNKLRLDAKNVIRTTESIYKEQFKNVVKSNDQWIDVLVEYPKLLQRPIIFDNNNACIARSALLLEEIL